MTSRDDDLPWVIIGCGRVGRTLALLAATLKIEVVAAWDRDGPPDVGATHSLSGSFHHLEPHVAGAAVFITVSDDAIASVAGALKSTLVDAAVVAHCSGSLPSGVLRRAGVTAPVVSVHPLLAVADPAEAVRQFESAAWTVEGSNLGVWWARGWLARIGVEPATIDGEQKVLYHAAAVTSAGLVVTVMDLAFELAAAAGFTPEQARSMLLPLAHSSLDNLEDATTREALTGPVARRDFKTVQAHVAAMREVLPEASTALYAQLTERSKKLDQ